MSTCKSCVNPIKLDLDATLLITGEDSTIAEYVEGWTEEKRTEPKKALLTHFCTAALEIAAILAKLAMKSI